MGTPKIDDFGPFFKNRCPKFLPTRKKRVFRVADFFEKSRKWGFILGCAPKFFFHKLAVWWGSPPTARSLSTISSLFFLFRVQCFASNHKIKMVWFTDLVLFLAFCNKAHTLNKPSKGKQ